MAEEPDPVGMRLNVLLDLAGLDLLDSATSSRFSNYLSLLVRWNTRVNLTAIRDEEGILRRHFVESIACSRSLPAEIRTLLDYGSGAGFPGIPIALCRPEIAVTLAESQAKKAAFLQEAVRVLQVATRVFAGRAEAIATKFDCVTLRAVDQMMKAVKHAGRLVGHGGWLVPMTTGAELAAVQAAAGAEFSWTEPVRLPGGEDRLLALGQRISSPV